LNRVTNCLFLVDLNLPSGSNWFLMRNIGNS